MTATTNLVLSGQGVPPYSARGLSQSLEPIGEASYSRRTINGTLLDLSASQFQKYKSTIQGNDQQPPACSGKWPGKTLAVDCVAELCFEVSSSAEETSAGVDAEAERTVVSWREESGFIFYRPRLVMMVKNFTTTRDEYGHVTSWAMELEEV